MLDTREKQSKHQYLVKWEGYSSAENTWELLSNLENASEITQEFKEMHNVSSEALAKCRWNVDQLLKTKLTAKRKLESERIKF